MYQFDTSKTQGTLDYLILSYFTLISDNVIVANITGTVNLVRFEYFLRAIIHA